MWESNPPRTVRPAAGFEDQEGHRAQSASVVYQAAEKSLSAALSRPLVAAAYGPSTPRFSCSAPPYI